LFAIDDFNAAAMQLKPASAFKSFEQAADDFPRRAEFIGEFLMRYFDRVRIIGELQETPREPVIHAPEGDIFQQADQIMHALVYGREYEIAKLYYAHT